RAVGQPMAQQGFQTSEKPARYGASVGLENGDTGTYGCRVLLGDDRICILSNCHVLADEGNAPLESRIVQPGQADFATDRRPVARLVNRIPLHLTNWGNSAPNKVDCAVAWTHPNQCAARFHNEYTFDPTPAAATENMVVVKEGRTTGYTKGIITSIAANVNV